VAPHHISPQVSPMLFSSRVRSALFLLPRVSFSCSLRFFSKDSKSPRSTIPRHAFSSKVENPLQMEKRISKVREDSPLFRQRPYWMHLRFFSPAANLSCRQSLLSVTPFFGYEDLYPSSSSSPCRSRKKLPPFLETPTY